MIEFQYLNQAEAAAVQRVARLAVLPLGAVESHGDHLPLGTDNLLAERLARRFVERLPEGEAILLPTLAYGPLWSTEEYPGSLTISQATFVALLVDLGCSLARKGIRAMAAVNAHYGNLDGLKQAGRLLQERGLTLLSFTYPGADAVADRVRETPVVHPRYMHACEIETSYMLALAPEHVDLARATANFPTFPDTFDVVQTRWSVFSGDTPVLGDPRLASAEKGEAILSIVLDRMVALTGQALSANLADR
jgi:creatinine amidohydrolase